MSDAKYTKPELRKRIVARIKAGITVVFIACEMIVDTRAMRAMA